MKKIKITLILVSLPIFFNLSYASAYQIFEQDGASLGTDHAGTASSADSAATEWYNPAGMVLLKKQQLSIGGEIVKTKVNIKGVQTNAATDTPIDANGGVLTPIPNIHYVLPLPNGFAFGVGVVVPFGAETDYGDDTAIKYNATKTKLQAIDITPAIAYKVTNNLSVGAGLDLTYVTGEFDGVETLGTAQGVSTNKGSDFAVGYHLGVLMQLNKNNRVGLAYHSKIVADLTGESTLDGSLNFMNIVSHDFNTQIILPAWWDLSYYSNITDKLALMGTVTYTQWDSVKDINLNNVVGEFGKITIHSPQNFSNSFSSSLGAKYQLSKKWGLMFGVGFDQSPTNDTNRTVQIPDEDRVTLATGVKYNVSRSMSVSMSYAHFFVKNASLSSTTVINGQEQTVKGTSVASADLLGLQMNWKF